MYIDKVRRWYGNDGQHIGRGRFLILIAKWNEDKTFEMRGVVRHVALSQFGHWMMGVARMYGHSVTVSGSYGADGLTKDLERLPETIRERVWDEGVPLPDDLRAARNIGGGWNSAGSEAPLMREWAKKCIIKN